MIGHGLSGWKAHQHPLNSSWLRPSALTRAARKGSRVGMHRRDFVSDVGLGSAVQIVERACMHACGCVHVHLTPATSIAGGSCGAGRGLAHPQHASPRACELQPTAASWPTGVRACSPQPHRRPDVTLACQRARQRASAPVC